MHTISNRPQIELSIIAAKLKTTRRLGTVRLTISQKDTVVASLAQSMQRALLVKYILDVRRRARGVA